MQHFKSRWTILVFLAVVLISWKWQIVAILLGAELCSQSLHESIHHPNNKLASSVFRFLGLAIVIAGALFIP